MIGDLIASFLEEGIFYQHAQRKMNYSTFDDHSHYLGQPWSSSFPREAVAEERLGRIGASDGDGGTGGHHPSPQARKSPSAQWLAAMQQFVALEEEEEEEGDEDSTRRRRRAPCLASRAAATPTATANTVCASVPAASPCSCCARTPTATPGSRPPLPYPPRGGGAPTAPNPPSSSTPFVSVDAAGLAAYYQQRRDVIDARWRSETVDVGAAEVFLNTLRNPSSQEALDAATWLIQRGGMGDEEDEDGEDGEYDDHDGQCDGGDGQQQGRHYGADGGPSDGGQNCFDEEKGGERAAVAGHCGQRQQQQHQQEVCDGGAVAGMGSSPTHNAAAVSSSLQTPSAGVCADSPPPPPSPLYGPSSSSLMGGNGALSAHLATPSPAGDGAPSPPGPLLQHLYFANGDAYSATASPQQRPAPSPLGHQQHQQHHQQQHHHHHHHQQQVGPPCSSVGGPMVVSEACVSTPMLLSPVGGGPSAQCLSGGGGGSVGGAAGGMGMVVEGGFRPYDGYGGGVEGALAAHPHPHPHAAVSARQPLAALDVDAVVAPLMPFSHQPSAAAATATHEGCCGGNDQTALGDPPPPPSATAAIPLSPPPVSVIERYCWIPDVPAAEIAEVVPAEALALYAFEPPPLPLADYINHLVEQTPCELECFVLALALILDGTRIEEEDGGGHGDDECVQQEQEQEQQGGGGDCAANNNTCTVADHHDRHDADSVHGAPLVALVVGGGAVEGEGEGAASSTRPSPLLSGPQHMGGSMLMTVGPHGTGEPQPALQPNSSSSPVHAQHSCATTPATTAAAVHCHHSHQQQQQPQQYYHHQQRGMNASFSAGSYAAARAAAVAVGGGVRAGVASPTHSYAGAAGVGGGRAAAVGGSIVTVSASPTSNGAGNQFGAAGSGAAPPSAMLRRQSSYLHHHHGGGSTSLSTSPLPKSYGMNGSMAGPLPPPLPSMVGGGVGGSSVLCYPPIGSASSTTVLMGVPASNGAGAVGGRGGEHVPATIQQQHYQQGGRPPVSGGRNHSFAGSVHHHPTANNGGSGGDHDDRQHHITNNSYHHTHHHDVAAAAHAHDCGAARQFPSIHGAHRLAEDEGGGGGGGTSSTADSSTAAAAAASLLLGATACSVSTADRPCPCPAHGDGDYRHDLEQPSPWLTPQPAGVGMALGDLSASGDYAHARMGEGGVGASVLALAGNAVGAQSASSSRVGSGGALGVSGMGRDGRDSSPSFYYHSISAAVHNTSSHGNNTSTPVPAFTNTNLNASALNASVSGTSGGGGPAFNPTFNSSSSSNPTAPPIPMMLTGRSNGHTHTPAGGAATRPLLAAPRVGASIRSEPLGPEHPHAALLRRRSTVNTLTLLEGAADDGSQQQQQPRRTSAANSSTCRSSSNTNSYRQTKSNAASSSSKGTAVSSAAVTVAASSGPPLVCDGTPPQPSSSPEFCYAFAGTTNMSMVSNAAEGYCQQGNTTHINNNIHNDSTNTHNNASTATAVDEGGARGSSSTAPATSAPTPAMLADSTTIFGGDAAREEGEGEGGGGAAAVVDFLAGEDQQQQQKLSHHQKCNRLDAEGRGRCAAAAAAIGESPCSGVLDTLLHVGIAGAGGGGGGGPLSSLGSGGVVSPPPAALAALLSSSTTGPPMALPLTGAAGGGGGGGMSAGASGGGSGSHQRMTPTTRGGTAPFAGSMNMNMNMNMNGSGLMRRASSLVGGGHTNHSRSSPSRPSLQWSNAHIDPNAYMPISGGGGDEGGDDDADGGAEGLLMGGSSNNSNVRRFGVGTPYSSARRLVPPRPISGSSGVGMGSRAASGRGGGASGGWGNSSVASPTRGGGGGGASGWANSSVVLLSSSLSQMDMGARGSLHPSPAGPRGIGPSVATLRQAQPPPLPLPPPQSVVGRLSFPASPLYPPPLHNASSSNHHHHHHGRGGPTPMGALPSAGVSTTEPLIAFHTFFDENEFEEEPTDTSTPTDTTATHTADTTAADATTGTTHSNLTGGGDECLPSDTAPPVPSLSARESNTLSSPPREEEEGSVGLVRGPSSRGGAHVPTPLDVTEVSASPQSPLGSKEADCSARARAHAVVAVGDGLVRTPRRGPRDDARERTAVEGERGGEVEGIAGDAESRRKAVGGTPSPAKRSSSRHRQWREDSTDGAKDELIAEERTKAKRKSPTTMASAAATAAEVAIASSTPPPPAKDQQQQQQQHRQLPSKNEDTNDHNYFMVCTRSIHRLFLAALLTCVKMRVDKGRRMSLYSAIGGLATADLRAIEVAFLGVLSFDARVSTPYYLDVLYSLRQHCTYLVYEKGADWAAEAWSNLFSGLPLPSHDSLVAEATAANVNAAAQHQRQLAAEYAAEVEALRLWRDAARRGDVASCVGPSLTSTMPCPPSSSSSNSQQQQQQQQRVMGELGEEGLAEGGHDGGEAAHQSAYLPLPLLPSAPTLTSGAVAPPPIINEGPPHLMGVAGGGGGGSNAEPYLRFPQPLTLAPSPSGGIGVGRSPLSAFAPPMPTAAAGAQCRDGDRAACTASTSGLVAVAAAPHSHHHHDRHGAHHHSNQSNHHQGTPPTHTTTPATTTTSGGEGSAQCTPISNVSQATPLLMAQSGRGGAGGSEYRCGGSGGGSAGNNRGLPRFSTPAGAASATKGSHSSRLPEHYRHHDPSRSSFTGVGCGFADHLSSCSETALQHHLLCSTDTMAAVHQQGDGADNDTSQSPALRNADGEPPLIPAGGLTDCVVGGGGGSDLVTFATVSASEGGSSASVLVLSPPAACDIVGDDGGATVPAFAGGPMRPWATTSAVRE